MAPGDGAGPEIVAQARHAVAAGLDVSEHRRLTPVEPNARLSRIAVEDARIARLD